MHFKLKKTTPLCKLMDAYCANFELSLQQMLLMFNADSIAPEDTAQMLASADGEHGHCPPVAAPPNLVHTSLVLL